MKKLNIMLVDDSTTTTKKMAQMVAEMGHEVIEVAVDGKDAIRKYPTACPDIVTMDITMPNMSGVEATRGILAEHPDALIIIVTSHGQENMVVDSIEAGAKGYILKPIKPEIFEKTIERVFEKYSHAKTNS